jgi:cation transport ATPase
MNAEDESGKKNRPTRSRREAEAARMAALHPKLTKRESKERERQASAKRSAQRLAEYEQAPERVLMRNYVDSRWTLTEFMLPIMIVMLAASLLGSAFPTLVLGVTIALYVMAVGAVINVFFAWRGFKDELQNRYPGTSTKGLLSSMLSRMMALRRLRNPGPVISRREVY